jgi:hypothetical protein
VDGSPSAAENPPHDRRWREAIASTAAGQGPCAEVQVDFFLQRGRVLIDLDNLVRLAMDGIRDAGILRRGLAGLNTIAASKRVAPPLGLGITLGDLDTPAEPVDVLQATELVAEASDIPREGNHAMKLAWRERVRAAWPGPVRSGPVGLDIVARTDGSLGAILKPVIDGLEPYLGRGTVGRGEFRPLDERIVLLRVRRDAQLPVALRITAGPPRQQPALGSPPPEPALPEMEPGFTFSMSDVHAIERYAAWKRIFVDPPGWAGEVQRRAGA